MDIIVRLAFDERGSLRLLNWLAYENAIILTQRPELPLLYDSHVFYETETTETWSDCLSTLNAGVEDCDSLSAWRAGELMARGHRALHPWSDGYRYAQAHRPAHIAADCVLKTRSSTDRPGGLYHCITRYFLGSHTYYDDPSARLGMNSGWDPRVVAHRRRLGTWRR